MNEADLVEHLESSELVPFSLFSKLHASLNARKKKSSVKLDKDDSFDSYLAEGINVTSEKDLQSHLETIGKTYDVNDKAVWRKLINRGFASRNAKTNGKKRKMDKETEYSQAVQSLSQDVKPVVQDIEAVQTSALTTPPEVKKKDKENNILEKKEIKTSPNPPSPKKKIFNPFKR